jgi:hypothetical protein
MKFLIVSFDGLRPDLISAELTRVLSQALGEQVATNPPDAPELEMFEAGLGSYAQVLRRVRVGDTSYVDGGWAESRAGRIVRQMQA